MSMALPKVKEAAQPSPRIPPSRPRQRPKSSLVLELYFRATLSCGSGLPTANSKFSYKSSHLLSPDGGGHQAVHIVVLVLAVANRRTVQIKDGCAIPIRYWYETCTTSVLRG